MPPCMWPHAVRPGSGGCHCPTPVRREDLVTSLHPMAPFGKRRQALSTPVLTQGFQGGLQPKVNLVFLFSLRVEWGQGQHVLSAGAGLRGPERDTHLSP